MAHMALSVDLITSILRSKLRGVMAFVSLSKRACICLSALLPQKSRLCKSAGVDDIAGSAGVLDRCVLLLQLGVGHSSCD